MTRILLKLTDTIPYIYERHGVTIEIHRADRDENKYGWRALIPEISDRKVRYWYSTASMSWRPPG